MGSCCSLPRRTPSRPCLSVLVHDGLVPEHGREVLTHGVESTSLAWTAKPVGGATRWT
jgi:hypothetical protein